MHCGAEATCPLCFGGSLLIGCSLCLWTSGISRQQCFNLTILARLPEGGWLITNHLFFSFQLQTTCDRFNVCAFWEKKSWFLYQMFRSLSAILGGTAAGLTLVLIVVVLWFYKIHYNTSSARNSETASSDPPATTEWNGGGRVSSTDHCHLNGRPGARQFTLEELERATKNFNENNLVGHGSFGAVYKGLLSDGTVVAIKRRMGNPNKELIKEVHYLSDIRHRNLVIMIGYCQEGGLQMLVFDYLPNGCISAHLHGTGQDPKTRLEFKQRLSIALGAAKGLHHLHGLFPSFVHGNFMTNNVLVDENFTAKVADAGIDRLLRIVDTTSTAADDGNVFQDPEFEELGILSQKSDVYSFGVFLLELVTGQSARLLSFSEVNENLTQWVESQITSEDFIDRRLGSSYTSEGMKSFLGLISKCLYMSGRMRPTMEGVVSELDWILETEMTLTTVMGDGTAVVTLGSQLFSSA